MKPPIFLDASFWISYRDARQADFARARELVMQFFRHRERFVTTVPVFCEIHAHFAHHAGRRRTIVADFWNNPLVQFEPVTHADHQAALAIISQHDDKDYPFCDVLSFVVMRRLEVTRVATFDDHFRQFGEFEVVG